MKDKTENVEKVKEPKKRVRGAKGKIAGKIIAAFMVFFMLMAVCATPIYFLVNQ